MVHNTGDNILTSLWNSVFRIIFGVILMAINFFIDILYVLLDTRIEY